MFIRNRQGEIIVDTDIVSDLSEIDLREANFAGLDTEGLNLSDAVLEGADFNKADLYWASFFRAKCKGCNFRDARLSGAMLENADLRETDVRGAYVSYDNLGGSSSVAGSNLTDAQWSGADLRGCEYDEDTLLPIGLDPEVEGMTFFSKTERDTRYKRQP